MNKKKIIKSAIDGRFAPKEDLEDHPEVTYQQTVEVKPRRKKESADSAETVETEVEIVENEQGQ